MHLHLLNCHGEWTALAVVLAHMPLVGMWIKHRRCSMKTALTGGDHVWDETPTDG